MAKSTDLPQSRLSVPNGLDESEFFSSPDGTETLTSRADLEAEVPNNKKDELVELERYWVNKPYAFAIIYRNSTRQELQYYLVEPATSDIEDTLIEFLATKLRHTIEYESVAAEMDQSARAEIIRNSLLDLLNRYDLIPDNGGETTTGLLTALKQRTLSAVSTYFYSQDETLQTPLSSQELTDGAQPTTLSPDQVEKITYYLIRNFVRYDKIDGLKYDNRIEEISCDGYNTSIWVYHANYEHIMTNIDFSPQALDEFVISAAQAAGKGISKRQPQVDAALRDGSRAQLTLGTEVSDKGTNFTIREFMDIPHTPIDLVNWQTFSMSEMILLWLAVENGLSTVVSGGTASGKTTTLNALSLFIPASKKIVSIEDTREIQIPQENWIASTTRQSFHKGDGNEINEMELVETALRQRPDYLLMGEVRGEEAQALFQAMNTGHTVFTTFHANDKNETLRRFTGDPLNVSPPLLEAVDIIISQVQTKAGGDKVRRAQSIASVGGSTDNSLKTTTLFSWNSTTDEHEQLISHVGDTGVPDTDIVHKIKQLNGWTTDDLRREWTRRKAVLASLINNGITAYADVAAVIQAFNHAPEVILGLIAESRLADRVQSLRSMHTITVDVDQEAENDVPRPGPPTSLQEQIESFLVDNRQSLTPEQSVNTSPQPAAQTPPSQQASQTEMPEPARDTSPDPDADASTADGTFDTENDLEWGPTDGVEQEADADMPWADSDETGQSNGEADADMSWADPDGAGQSNGEADADMSWADPDETAQSDSSSTDTTTPSSNTPQQTRDQTSQDSQSVAPNTAGSNNTAASGAEPEAESASDSDSPSKGEHATGQDSTDGNKDSDTVEIDFGLGIDTDSEPDSGTDTGLSPDQSDDGDSRSDSDTTQVAEPDAPSAIDEVVDTDDTDSEPASPTLPSSSSETDNNDSGNTSPQSTDTDTNPETQTDTDQ